MQRIQKHRIIRDLDKKMVFIAGPRQAGKTWLAKNVAADFSNSVYLNYDRQIDRQIIHAETWLESTELLILDEVHKMPLWKDHIKGIYDTKPDHLKIIVTGSARLDVANQHGDSLAGRYFLHHLLPLSPSELSQLKLDTSLDRLLTMGNFPEPYLEDNVVEAQRWRNQYSASLLREDVLNFDSIQNLRALQLVYEILRTRVGSPISYQSIAEDVGVSPNTVKKYIQILEALYIIFRVSPYSKNIARSLLKEPKVYFFDTALVNGDAGAKFENLVAFCLLKDMYARRDYKAEQVKLHYLRTKDKREVDFAIALNGELEKIIEVKNSDAEISKNLSYFHEQNGVPAIQVVNELKREYKTNGIIVRRGVDFLRELEL